MLMLYNCIKQHFARKGEKSFNLFQKSLIFFFFLQDSVVFGSALNIKFGHLVTFK